MQRSAGILLYRRLRSGDVEVLLVHMGGPYFARKDKGAWTIPKGIPDTGEHLWAAARREFAEETGQAVPDGPAQPLGEVKQASGKVVTAYAVEGEIDVEAIRSNTFQLEWPPRSGQVQDFPEIDRGAWFAPDQAREVMVSGQAELLDRLAEALAGPAAEI